MTYNAVKAAEISLCKALARELAPQNIRVNTVAPGSILFPGGSWDQRQQADPEGIADFVSAICRSAASARPTKSARWSLPRLAARELDQRRVRSGRRLPGHMQHLKATC